MSLSGFHPLTVASVTRETADAVSVTFAVPEGLREVFAFRPGQYLTLRAVLGGEEARRAYSICAGADEGVLRVGIKQVPGGVFSGFANHVLKAGDVLDVMPPEGRFGIVPAGARRIVGIAAGSGITPVLSILRSFLAAGAGHEAALLYGSRSTGEIMFRGALEDLKDRYLTRFSVTHVLSREAQDVPVLHGRLDAGRIAALLPGAAPDAVYVCGPEGVIEAGVAVFGAIAQTERFAAGPRAVVETPKMSGVMATIIFDGKTNTIAVPPGEPILEAALAAGLDLPWSCRGGMCSTCRARLVEGQAVMEANFSLERWETEAGFVLTCQAHPTTAHVVVDYDQV